MSPEDYEDEQYQVKGERRAKKLDKKRNMMRVNSRGLKDVILPVLAKRAKKAKKSDFKLERVTREAFKSISFNY